MSRAKIYELNQKLEFTCNKNDNLIDNISESDSKKITGGGKILGTYPYKNAD